MVTFSGIQANNLYKKDEIIEVNPLATQPTYFVNDPAQVDLPLDSVKTKIDLSAARDKALFVIHSRRQVSLQHYLPNLPEYFGRSNPPLSPQSPPPPAPPPPPDTQDRQPCSNDPDVSHDMGGSQNSNETQGAGNGNYANDVESKATDAAEELVEEANSLAEQLENGDWTKEDKQTGFEYIDPEFYVLYEQLTSILNALQVIGTIIDTLNDLKAMALSGISPDKRQTNGSLSVSEAVGSVCEIAGLMSQGQLLELTEMVWTHNNALIEKTVTQAKEDAKAGAWSWITYVWTIGANDAVQRDKDEQVAEATSKLMDKYAAFMRKVQNEYEKVLGDSSLYEDGITDMASVFNGLTWQNMTVDIGSDRVDIDRDKILAYQMYFDNMQSYRRIYFMLRRAKQELENMVFEGRTGYKSSTNLSDTLNSLLQGIENFESSVFSAMASQLQTAIGVHNSAEDAYDTWQMQKCLLWSARDPFLGGGTPLIGGLTRGITDFFALEYWNLTTDDTTSPSQLDINRTYQILAELMGTSVSQLRNDINNYDDDIKKLNELEQEEWKIIGQLNESNVTYTSNSDGISGVKEEKVNSLRESLTNIQNLERAIAMLIEAKSRLKAIVLKLSTGLGSMDGISDASKILKNSLDSRLLAFDLKFAGIKNKVDAHNKQVQETEMVEKAAYVAIGSAVGVGLAVILLVAGIFTGGASVVAAIGFIAAMGQLGAAAGQIVYNATNQIDDNIYEKTDYYSETQNEIEEKYNSQLDRLDENSHVDAENSKDPFSAGDQWAKDTELFMEVRDQLTKIYIYEQIMMMLLKAQEDLKSMALASISGGYIGEDFQTARDASKAQMETKVNAYELKSEMIEDIISRYNLKISQDTETNWAIVSAIVAAASIACAGLGSVAEEAVQEALEGVQAGLDIAGAALNAAKNYLTASSGYGELEEYKNMMETINLITEGCSDSETQQVLRTALTDMQAANMTTSIGSGQVAVDASLYYQNMRALQCLYNRITLALRIADTIGRLRAKVVKGPTPFGMSDAVEAEKSNYLKQLDLAYESVQTYVERSNEMAQAWRQLAVSATLVVVQILLKISEKFEWTDKIKDKVGDWAEKKLGKEGKIPEVTVVDSIKMREKLAGVLTGNKAWDGTIGVRDLTNGIIDLATNSSFITFVVNKIYDGHCNRNKVEAKGVEGLSTNTGSAVENAENAAYNNQLKLAQIQLTSEALGMDQQLLNELQNFITSMVQDNIDSITNDVSKSALDAFNGPEQLGKGKEGTKELPIPVSEQTIFTKQLQCLADNVDWNDPVKVSEYLQKVDQLAGEAKNAEGKPLDDNQRIRMEAAAAILVADQMPTAVEARKNAQTTVQKVFDTELNKNTESRSKLQLQYADAVLAAMAKNAKGEAKQELNNAVNMRIFEVWKKVANGEMTAVEANNVCSLVEMDRPEVVEAARRTADLLKNPDAAAAAAKEKADDPQKMLPKKQLLIDIYARAKVLEDLAKTENPTPEQLASYKEHLSLLSKDVVKLQALFEGVEVGSERYQAIEAEVGAMDEDQLASCLLGLKEDKGFKKIIRNFPNLGMCIGESIDILQKVEKRKADVSDARLILQQVENEGAQVSVATLLQGIREGNRRDRVGRLLEKMGGEKGNLPESDQPDFMTMVDAVAGNGNHSGGNNDDASEQGFGGHKQQAGSEVWEGWMDAQNGVTAGRDGGVSV